MCIFVYLYKQNDHEHPTTRIKSFFVHLKQYEINRLDSLICERTERGKRIVNLIYSCVFILIYLSCAEAAGGFTVWISANGWTIREF